MDLNSILNQVLDVAKNSASKLETGNQTIDSLTKVGGGAALGGILSMILGRSGGASLAKLGSLAVLGNLAYQAYQNYQKSQQNSQPNNRLSHQSRWWCSIRRYFINDFRP